MKHHTHAERPRQEEDLLPPRLLLYVILAVIVFSFVLAFVSYRIQKAREHDLRPSGRFPERELGPITERSKVYEELFTNRGKRQTLAIEARQSLGHFGWVAEPGGLVRVPIDVAMDLVVSGAGP